MTNIKLPPLPPLHIVPSVEPVDYPEVAQALMDYAREAVLADRQHRVVGVTDDMRAAVRFAPSSAYWSERLREFFGPDAREGIDALEKQLRDASAALEAVRNDAARYRWLRTRWGRIADEYDGDSDQLVAIREADSHFEGWDVDPASLDRAIDAAIAAEKREG